MKMYKEEDLRVVNNYEPEEEIKSLLQYLNKRTLLISEQEHIHSFAENLKCSFIFEGNFIFDV